ncbi:MAG: TRAP transporter small permease [Hyphomicrobiaceae bacterium]
MPDLTLIRTGLDRLYLAGGIVGALALLALLVVIVLQMASRWFSVPFPGATDYAGYLMATSSFMAFAYTLNRGGHIRVGLLLSALGRHRRWGELWCYAIGSALTCYLAWFAIRAVYFSWKLHDISQGQDETPLWIPQIPMAVGAVLLAIAFLDNLVCVLAVGKDNIEAEAVDQPRTE